MKTKAQRESQGGFSLVEVALALGIFSFAILSVFSLLPAGVQMHRDAMQDTAFAQIIQTLVNESKAMAWEDLQNNTRFFTEEGIEITPDNAGYIGLLPQQADALYEVDVIYNTNTQVTGSGHGNLATLTVIVRNNFSAEVDGSKMELGRYVAHLADRGESYTAP